MGRRVEDVARRVSVNSWQSFAGRFAGTRADEIDDKGFLS